MRTAWIALLALGMETAALAQAPARTPAAVQPGAARREARDAQADFERLRFRHLPWTSDRGGGDCDERIGRFCLTYGDPRDDEDWTPPPEP
ncbi:MAG TPA: hypothetical protein VHG91_07020, partial [Longimicrobium sp.]|nr:hypothetical protein [Longimicrobium sp.]